MSDAITDPEPDTPVSLRAPQMVMRLDRMGSAFATRLSFMRVLLRRIKNEAWRFERRLFDIDARGVGTALYTLHGPQQSYTLVAFGHDLPAHMRSDRVIATAWDATFTLFDGIPETADIERLRANIPLQEAGRVLASELSVSRANRSVRLFDHVVSSLAAGRQPDTTMVRDVGYLMRTTAVYGSGKLGAADRATLVDRPEFQAPFQVEMMSVWLTRAFILDLVEHMASLQAPGTAVKLDPQLRRSFGVGNSTGLGMAPFLVNHPLLLNNWILARETALARVRSLEGATAAEISAFASLLARALASAKLWKVEDAGYQQRIMRLQSDLTRLIGEYDTLISQSRRPWDSVHRWAEANLALDAQEQVVALLIESHGTLVDDLARTMAASEDEVFRIDGSISVLRMADILTDVYADGLATDWHQPQSDARIWYYSLEKLEPRLGERHEEPLEPYEQPLAPQRDAARMYHDICKWDPKDTLAAFLLAHPQHRHMARRAQIAATNPYCEIRDNTIAQHMLPIDLLRCKLAFFGAAHFDPRSDRWIRINMFQHAPFPHELGDGDVEADNWAYPGSSA
ncbi:MAG: hypothetical protein WBO55_07290 [Rhizobiaceae bacterium]